MTHVTNVLTVCQGCWEKVGWSGRPLEGDMPEPSLEKHPGRETEGSYLGQQEKHGQNPYWAAEKFQLYLEGRRKPF